MTRDEWVARFIIEAPMPLCPTCGHPWVMHSPDGDRGYACRACRCKRRFPPRQ